MTRAFPRIAIPLLVLCLVACASSPPPVEEYPALPSSPHADTVDAGAPVVDAGAPGTTGAAP